MRKVLAVCLLGSMLWFPVPTYASDNDQGVLKVISFDKIKEEVKNRNREISATLDQIDDADDMIANGVNGIKLSIADPSNNSKGLISYFSNKTSGIHIVNIDDAKLLVKGTDMTPIGGPISKNSIPLLDSNQEPLWWLGIIDVPEIDFTKDTTTMEVVMEAVIDYTNFNLLKLYQSQIMAAEGKIASLKSQQDNSWRSWIQREIAEGQIIWGAQQMYISYNSLTREQEKMTLNRSFLEKRLNIIKIQQQFGMATRKDLKSLESQLRDLDIAIKSLEEGRDSMKGSLNLMLGQAFDIDLTIQDTPELDSSKITELDYDEDLDKAIVQSYNIFLQDSSDDEERQAEKDKVRFDFDKSYKAVKDKKVALDNEKYKLNNEQENWDIVQLKYSLGMISRVELESGQVAFKSQVLKVTTAKEDLLKAYTAYNWMLKGISVSAGAAQY